MSVAFLLLSGCVRADSPEVFQPDPHLLNDYSISLPQYGRSGDLHYEIVQGHAILQGDIILGEVRPDGSLIQTLQTRGLGRNDLFGRWPDGIVPFQDPSTNSAIQQLRIQDAMDHWMEETSITFVERTSANASQYPNYIRFDNSNSCASYVGMQGGAQSILVSDGCSMGSIVHEIGHALGLFHEHTRLDRDSFVQIDWDQIVPGKEINFQILSAGIEDIGEYDYGSIMHYGEYFFTATGSRTIIAPNNVSIGQRVALSDRDASSVNTLFATDLALFQPSVNPVDGGLEIDLSVVNQGNLGSQLPRIEISTDEQVDWSGMTANSDWDCSQSTSLLTCTLPVLQEGNTSGFSVIATAVADSPDTISVNLSSRTFDTDTSNNSYTTDGLRVEDTAPNNETTNQNNNTSTNTNQTASSPDTDGSTNTSTTDNSQTNTSTESPDEPTSTTTNTNQSTGGTDSSNQNGQAPSTAAASASTSTTDPEAASTEFLLIALLLFSLSVRRMHTIKIVQTIS